MTKHRSRRTNVEPRIYRDENNTHLIIVTPEFAGGQIHRTIGTLDEAREALRRFDETGELPQARHKARGELSAPEAARLLGISRETLRLWAAEGRVPSHTARAGGKREMLRFRRADVEALDSAALKRGVHRQSEQQLPLEPEDRSAMPDHLQVARTALQATITELEAQLNRARSALALLEDEGDASAEYRRPGAQAPAHDFTAAPEPPRSGGRKKAMSSEEVALVRRTIVESLSPTEPMTMRQLWEVVANRLETMTSLDMESMRRQMTAVRRDGKIRLDEADGVPINFRWFRAASGEPADAPAAQ